jgi:ribosomal protein S18 acetylase RimI-like enzyme
VYSQIDISEVGPAEYPLIAVLRDTIFGEFGHRYSARLEEQAKDRKDVLALIAHLEGNPVGYKIGYHDRPGLYYSWSGGVLKEYRGQGLARRMQDWQHGWLRARGYRMVHFGSFNKFRSMLQFGLSTGFAPTGVDLAPEGELSIKFRKDLTQPDPARRAALPRVKVHVESVGPNFHGLVAQLAGETLDPTTEEAIDKAMTNVNALALVAFVESVPVGFAVGHGEDNLGERFQITQLGVLPVHRDQGVGAAILRHALTATACRAVRFQARPENVQMIRAAVAAGFDIAGLVYDSLRGGPVVVLEARATS